eukprot:s892_g15.t1
MFNVRARAMASPVDTVYGCQVDEEEGSLESLAAVCSLKDLPPLPAPLWDKHLQSLGGFAYVSAQIAFIVGGTHGLVLTTLPQLAGRDLLRNELWWTFCIAIYAEATETGETAMRMTVCRGNMPCFLLIIFMSFVGTCTGIAAFLEHPMHWRLLLPRRVAVPLGTLLLEPALQKPKEDRMQACLTLVCARGTDGHNPAIKRTPKKDGPCPVGSAVFCPGTMLLCQKDQCCPDGSLCPSAPLSATGRCLKDKVHDCTGGLGQKPAEKQSYEVLGECQVGARVKFSGLWPPADIVLDIVLDIALSFSFEDDQVLEGEGRGLPPEGHSWDVHGMLADLHLLHFCKLNQRHFF